MCFSASASFAAGVVVLGIGVLSVRAARQSHERPFAAIPLLFAVQQLVEGALWLTFEREAAPFSLLLTYLYSFFSHVLWPVYVPLAVWLLEPPGARRRHLLVLLALGVAVGIFLLVQLAAFAVFARPSGGHIEYVSPHHFAAAAMAVYLLATCASPMLSSHRTVQAFGGLAALSFVAAYGFYTTWFISVWCLFAALLSMSVYVHFASRRASFASWRRLVNV